MAARVSKNILQHKLKYQYNKSSDSLNDFLINSTAHIHFYIFSTKQVRYIKKSSGFNIITNESGQKSWIKRFTLVCQHYFNSKVWVRAYQHFIHIQHIQPTAGLLCFEAGNEMCGKSCLMQFTSCCGMQPLFVSSATLGISAIFRDVPLSAQVKIIRGALWWLMNGIDVTL